MIFEGKVRPLEEHVVRLGDDLAHVDMVRTSQGWVRVGSMPEIAKLLRLARTPPHYVVVLPSELAEVGDGMTGEEFICWSSIDAAKFAGTYIGTDAALEALRWYLEPSVPYYLDEELTSIARRDWLDTPYCPHPVGSGGAVRFGPLEIHVEDGQAQVCDGGVMLYDSQQAAPVDVSARITAALDRVPRPSEVSEGLEILVVGSGNGHVGNTSSFLLRLGDRRVWVDPSAGPHETLAADGVHWDDVTDVLVTHIHEDHLGGLTACLARARRREVTPGQCAKVGSAEFEFRLNHHNLPSGTLGLKVRFNGRSLGISGDTRYDEVINRRLGRPELEAEWFADCHLVFHEVDLN